MKEEEEYLEWLKGQRQTLSKDKSVAAELVCLLLCSFVSDFRLVCHCHKSYHSKLSLQIGTAG